MRLAAVARHIRYRRTIAEVALGAYRKNWRRTSLHMFGTNIIRGEQRYKRRRSRGSLDIGAAASFFPLHQAQYAGNLKSILARRLNRLDGRCARSADVVDNHYPRRSLPKALDTLPG